VLTVPAGGSGSVRLRLTDLARDTDPFADFDSVMGTRRAEADRFWADTLTGELTDDERLMARQALAGMLWSKQFYALDVERWLAEHGADPLGDGGGLRNQDWRHLVAEDIISMPDTWEYPWFAAWDLAFHTVALAAVDLPFAKRQLQLLLDRRYLHPNGQLPAYEWNFSDVNPPVHAWATLFVYQLEKLWTGEGDRTFLEGAFQKLIRNVGWWLNRKDADNRNIFQGGFLGLDNIGVFDRSAPLPSGGRLDQADGTAWMALYCQNLTLMALELGRENPAYLEQAQALLENFAWIAAATNHVGPDGVGLWDETDGFFYDVLRRPDGSAVPLKVRSVVGLMPLIAATVVDATVRTEFPQIVAESAEFLDRHPAVTAAMWGRGRQAHESGPALFALFDEERMRRILARMLDEDEFLSPYGIRSVSRYHADHPYVLRIDGQEHVVAYRPAESDTDMFGGNSNWRGPVWVPINVMLIRALLNLHGYFGDGLRVECPTGSGRELTLYEVAREISDRLTGAFLRNGDGHRPVHGGQPMPQTDPHWRDLVLFYEYLHGDNGAGIGASHQTGWTGCVAVLPLLFRGPNAGRLTTLRGGVRPFQRAAQADRPRTGWPEQPVIYEVNTAVWLDELSRTAGRRLTLAEVPPDAWDAVTPPGTDAVWLMGVWERSPAGLAIAHADATLRESFRAALPDVRDGDVIGSPYCVRRYVVDEIFGGPDGLAAARAALAQRRARLILDYVPNHVAPDHPWVTGNPELFVHGTAEDLRTDPAGWLATDRYVLARGRDPNFPAWPDVVQLNALAPALRTATTETLASIAAQCDGIRCDMAMLMTSDVFAKTWGDRAGLPPVEDFWSAVLTRLRTRHPQAVLIAEAYWDMEWELQQQGFDFCYDKRLYDRIVRGDVPGVRDHLRAEPGYQARLLRFLENHDEPRITTGLPTEALRPAAVALATLPGATLWHEGQFEGRRVRPPVFLARRPEEAPDRELADWYRRLVAAVRERGVRAGTWRLIDPVGWPDNPSADHLLAWSWTGGSGRYLVVVNLTAQPAQARIPVDWPDLRGRTVRLTDLLQPGVLDRDGSEIAESGLYVDLAPWQYHLLAAA
jgi:mannosylglycerate hydrolase MGH1-like protein